MSTSKPLALALIASLPIATFVSGAVAAVNPPDAGQTLQQQGPRTELAPLDSAPLMLDIPALRDQVPPGGPAAKIVQIDFEGNSEIGSNQLLQALGSERLAKPLDLSEIQSLAQDLTQYYQRQGYPFARVFVPQQTLDQGILKLTVVEGRYGKVSVKGEDKLVSELGPQVQVLKEGDVIRAAELERQVLLLNDLPGVAVVPRIRPGQQMGQGDLDLNATLNAGPSGSVSFDNFGNRFTGEYRANTSIRYNSPFRVGDLATFDGTFSDEGLLVGALGYSLPVGSSGLRLNASASTTHYELGKEFSNLQAQGTAETIAVGGSYPYVRSHDINLTFSASYQYKVLKDKQDSTGTDNSKSSQSVPIAVIFDATDSVFNRQAVTFGSLSYTAGELDLDSQLLAADQATARTEGSFGKLNLNVSRLQSLSQRLSLSLRASRQWASKNLDSSEGFGIGGAAGVRAYPSGEGYGDEGWLLQAEVRYRANNHFQSYAFYDAGKVRINADPFAVGDNTRSLSGAGVGVKYYRNAWYADLFIASAIQGGDPLSDSQRRNPRVWFSIGYSLF